MRGAEKSRRTSRSQAIPGLAMLFELTAVVFFGYFTASIKFVPLRSWLGLDMPWCWYALYVVFVCHMALVVAGLWLALRGWKASPAASGCAIVLAGLWVTMSMWFFLPPAW